MQRMQKNNNIVGCTNNIVGCRRPGFYGIGCPLVLNELTRRFGIVIENIIP